MARDRVEDVVERLTHGTPIAREEAVGALRNLAYNNEENQVAIAAVGGIAPLVELVPRVVVAFGCPRRGY